MSYTDQVPGYWVELPCHHRFRSATKIEAFIGEPDTEDAAQGHDEDGVAWLYCVPCRRQYCLEGWELARPEDGGYQHFPTNAKGTAISEGQIAQRYDGAVLRDRVVAYLRKHRDATMADTMEETRCGQRVVRAVMFALGLSASEGPAGSEAPQTPVQSTATMEVEGHVERGVEPSGPRLHDRPAMQYADTRKARTDYFIKLFKLTSSVDSGNVAALTSARDELADRRAYLAKLIAEHEALSPDDVLAELKAEEIRRADEDVTNFEYQTHEKFANQQLSSRPESAATRERQR